MINKHLKSSLIIIALAAGVLFVVPVTKVFAVTKTCADGTTITVPSNIPAEDQKTLCDGNGGLKATTDSSSSSSFAGPPPPTDLSGDNSCSGGSQGQCVIFQKYLIPLINVISGVIGLVVVIMIVLGAIQYSAAGGRLSQGGGSPTGVIAAKKRITNAIFALIAFAFIAAFLQWIVPGGIFNGK